MPKPEMGIDRNVVQGGGDDFKMKINNRKASEMSDGTYRILTQATNTGSSIGCEYTTYDDDLGLCPVTATGSAISGGFQANTCYTLEVHCTSRTGSTAVEARYNRVTLYISITAKSRFILSTERWMPVENTGLCQRRRDSDDVRSHKDDGCGMQRKGLESCVRNGIG